LRKVKPLLKGRDLKKLGIPEGPLYSRILGELLDERLRGRLKTEEEEKKYLLARYAAPAKKKG
jgi:tRNA nucleotidyltransferase (CCA-adding enzyme)